MTNLRSIDHPSSRQSPRAIQPARVSTWRVAPEVAARTSIHLVPKRPLVEEQKSPGVQSGWRLGPADKMFVALALGGAAAMCWSVW